MVGPWSIAEQVLVSAPVWLRQRYHVIMALAVLAPLCVGAYGRMLFDVNVDSVRRRVVICSTALSARIIHI